MKLFHSHNEVGPPCRHMEPYLNRTADGSAGPLVRWYALAHAARCTRCNRFLDRLGETLTRLRTAKSEPMADDLMARLESKLAAASKSVESDSHA